MAALELPVPHKIRAKRFRLLHKQQVTAIGGGFIQTIDRANPLWFCDFETAPIDPTTSAYSNWITFLESLEGAMNTFLAFDPRRPRPLNNLLNHTSGPSGVTITAMSWTNGTVTLSGLTGITLKAGDYISYQQGNIWRLYRLVADRAGNGVVAVMPRPIEHTGLPLAVRLEKPVAEMKMLGDYTEDDQVESFPVFKFTGYQFINRS
jgi:hypothetical protein